MTPPKLIGWYGSKRMYQQSENVPTRSENQKKNDQIIIPKTVEKRFSVNRKCFFFQKCKGLLFVDS